ncbi:glycosyltransferase family 4 protein [Candidatus Bathyarchaeota archaeon]|nr:glycosyltransferase family 4 protein [Candidatus Bathyarchaeota archaeon]
MIVGIFHPALNKSGGAEWVALNIIKSLKSSGCRIVALTNEKTTPDRMERVFGCKANIDREIVFPLQFFPTWDSHNVYTDIARVYLLKSKCDVVIDTQSNSLLPGVGLTYVHNAFSAYAASERPQHSGRLRRSYYFPHLIYERKETRNSRHSNRMIFANSMYTADALRTTTGLNANLLYPPVSKVFYRKRDEINNKENLVVSLGRISREKRLDLVPLVARLADRRIHFLIVGTSQSSDVLHHVLRLIEKYGVSDRVSVLTDVTKDDLLNILLRSKVFFHPTEGEPFGISILEGMASGCVPIVHDSGGPAEFVPEALRFTQLDDAAKKIDKAIFNWSPNQGEQFSHLAEFFNEENFSVRFSRLFESYVKGYVL